MRVRLLLDVVLTMEQITALAEALADQPVATVAIDGNGTYGARFVGAQPVHEEGVYVASDHGS